MALSHALLGVGVGLFGVLALEPLPHPQSHAAAQSTSVKRRIVIPLMFPPEFCVFCSRLISCIMFAAAATIAVAARAL